MSTENKDRSKPGAPAVEAAIRILTYLSRYRNRNRTLAEISRDLELNKSTCYRILNVLTDYNLINYDRENKKFSLGTYLIILGSRAQEFNDYLKLAQQHLKELTRQTGHTCVLLEPVADRLAYVAKEEPDTPVRITVNIGQTFPLTSASFGKCYLAFLAEPEAEAIIRKVGIKPFTSRSITSYDQFIANLATIRQQGYAVSFEEHTPGVFGISAPVFDSTGKVKMIISCIGLTHQLEGEKIAQLADLVMSAGRNITAGFQSLQLK